MMLEVVTDAQNILQGSQTFKHQCEHLLLLQEEGAAYDHTQTQTHSVTHIFTHRHFNGDAAVRVSAVLTVKQSAQTSTLPQRLQRQQRGSVGFMQGSLVWLPQWGCWGTSDREGRGVSRKERLDRGNSGRCAHPPTTGQPGY